MAVRVGNDSVTSTTFFDEQWLARHEAATPEPLLTSTPGGVGGANLTSLATATRQRARHVRKARSASKGCAVHKRTCARMHRHAGPMTSGVEKEGRRVQRDDHASLLKSRRCYLQSPEGPLQTTSLVNASPLPCFCKSPKRAGRQL